MGEITRSQPGIMYSTWHQLSTGHCWYPTHVVHKAQVISGSARHCKCRLVLCSTGVKLGLSVGHTNVMLHCSTVCLSIVILDGPLTDGVQCVRYGDPTLYHHWPNTTIPSILAHNKVVLVSHLSRKSRVNPDSSVNSTREHCLFPKCLCTISGCSVVITQMWLSCMQLPEMELKHQYPCVGLHGGWCHQLLVLHFVEPESTFCAWSVPQSVDHRLCHINSICYNL